MQYGVAQLARDKTTKRVKEIKLWADTAADELWLTALEEALGSLSLRQLKITFACGREVSWNAEPE